MHRIRILFLSLLLAFASATTLKAAELAPDTHPNAQDMVKYKNDFLSKYDEIIYLDTDSSPTTEAAFFAHIVNEKRGFKLETVSTSPKRITLKLMSDAEQRAAQANTK